MIRINCPFCGPRDQVEFSYGGDGSIVYPPLDADATAWHDAVHQRENIRGLQVETWQHVYGCRQWLKVERSTVDHTIHSVRLAHDGAAMAVEAENGR